jgi:hypothetical protein
MCDEIPSQFAMKLRGNIDACYISKPYLRRTCCICDETSWKSATKFRRYSDSYGKKVKKLRRNSIDIATMTVGFKKNGKIHEIWYYAILQCNMVILHCNMELLLHCNILIYCNIYIP